MILTITNLKFCVKVAQWQIAQSLTNVPSRNKMVLRVYRKITQRVAILDRVAVETVALK